MIFPLHAAKIFKLNFLSFVEKLVDVTLGKKYVIFALFTLTRGVLNESLIMVVK